MTEGFVYLVSSFWLVQVVGGTTASDVNEAVVSTTPDTTFRWDSSDRQWIFNVNTKNLNANTTYAYAINLNDGTTIPLRYRLK